MNKNINNRIDIFIVSAAFFLEVLDATIFTPSLIDISDDLNVTIGITTIAIASYVCSLAVFTPLNMNFFSKIKVRKKFIIGMIIFFIASFLCSISNNIYILSIGRVIQGFGSALVVPVGRALVLSKTNKEDIPIVMAYLVWPALFAPVFAPIIGGYITQYYGWRYIFYFVLLLSLSIIMISFKWLSNGEHLAKDNEKINFRSYYPWLGIVLSIFAFFGFITNKYIELSFFSIIITFCFVYLLVKSKNNRIFNVDLLVNDFFRMNIVIGSFFRVAIYCFPVFLTLSLITIFGYTPLESGVCIVFIFLGNVITKPVAANVLVHIKNIRWYFIFSSFMTLISILFFWFDFIYKNIQLVYLLCFLHGIARSFQFLGYSSVAFYGLKKEILYQANILNSSIMQLNSMLGQSIPALLFTVIEFNDGLTVNGDFYLYSYVSIMFFLLLIPFLNSFFIKNKVN
ncbi:MFS transporter [Photorhabdus sp. CRCIA-P01]|uniref:MFS transporter n=1 Tax=Photorhabdus sp. CRCIA-P01 TaxID=2019570 RepID=UPI000E59F093|nr:MFS transporter [Photorhabdus sp. CRCIA-P01]